MVATFSHSYCCYFQIAVVYGNLISFRDAVIYMYIHTLMVPKLMGEDDLLDITDYLIELNKIDIYNLGLLLGLSKCRVEEMMYSRTFCDDVITTWLQKVDQVKKRGAPTWQRMVEALRHQRIGQNDIADKIEKDFKKIVT